MKNIIYLIFSTLLLDCTHSSSLDGEATISTYDEFTAYLNAMNITASTDTSMYIILPSSCISCTPWLASDNFFYVKNLSLITSNPKRYFPNFYSVYEDEQSDFLDLSFSKYGPILVEVIKTEKKCTSQIITNIESLQKIVPNL